MTSYNLVSSLAKMNWVEATPKGGYIVALSSALVFGSLGGGCWFCGGCDRGIWNKYGYWDG
jgi:hypothetical protein